MIVKASQKLVDGSLITPPLHFELSSIEVKNVSAISPAEEKHNIMHSYLECKRNKVPMP
jgi:hypothetical protein